LHFKDRWSAILLEEGWLHAGQLHSRSGKRFTAMTASRHDLRQVKRRSNWTDAEWLAFVSGYRSVFKVNVLRVI